MYTLSLPQCDRQEERNGTGMMIGWTKNDRDTKEMLDTERKEMRV
jgi:hypothetical protein